VTRRRRTRASASAPLPAAGAGDPSRIRGLALLLAALAAAPFLNSLTAPFVFDDHGSILENPTIQHFRTAFSGPIQSALAGRPLVNLSLAVSYAMSGTDPWAYHAWNLAVHILAGLVLFGLVRRTLRLRPPEPDGLRRDRSVMEADWLAFVAALVWLVHPLQTEVVDYVTQRTESLMGLCYLGTLYLALRAATAERDARRWAAAAVVVCAAGMACKESMASAPVMTLLFAAVFVDGGIAAAFRRRPAFYAALAATWLVLLALNVGAPRANSAGFSAGVSPWLYLQNQAVMLVRYLRLTVWPHGLVIDYGLPGPVPRARVIPGAILALALLAAVAVAWRRRPAVAFLGVWVIVTLAPTTSVIPIATEAGAERRMYLPLAAVAVAAVIGGWHLLQAAGARRWRVAAAAAAIVYLSLASLTAARNAEYHDPIVLWQAAVARYPNGGARYGLAMALRDAGRHDEAMEEFRAAAPDYPEAEYALGVDLANAGRRADAIEHYRAFVQSRPLDFKVPATYRLMGEAQKALGQYDVAADSYRRSLDMQPDNTDGLSGLADALYQGGHYQESADAYRRLLAQQPSNADAHNDLGLALVGLNRETEAVPEFQQAAALQPDDVRFLRNLGYALSGSNRPAEAAQAFRRAVALAPRDAGLYSSLGLALAAEGKADDAQDAFRQALALAPDDPQIAADVAQAMHLLGIK
jgi:tetratricopeptide (TPR) repeat protein